MKQVTMESVKQRINELTYTGVVSLRGEFELACLRELVAVTEQRDALVAENVALKEALTAVIDRSSEPEYHYAGMGCGVEDNGLQTDGYGACEYGWHEAMQRVYSEVIPRALPETPTTDAATASLRAEGVDMFAAQERAIAARRKSNGMDDCFIKKILETAENAEEFAKELRESKGEASNV